MSLIDRKTIDAVYRAVNIVDVVEDFVTLKKSGNNYKGLCPFHDEKTPSFVVTPSKGICHCFGCHKGGTAINFLMQLNNWTYPETIKWLAKKYNIEVVESENNPQQKQELQHREELYALNNWANDFFQNSLYNTEEGQGIGMTYLRSRQLRDDIIKKFQLGYCPASRHSLYDAATKNQLSVSNLIETGLCINRDNSTPYDRFHGRVIFPVHNQTGKIVAFGGRILQKRDNVGKYVNSPESAIYSKSHELYGLFFARNSIRKNDCCYLVEGYTDVISMHQCGIENVVASSGTALTHDQIRLIKKHTTNLTILYDGDNAGIKASLRGIDMLLEHGLNIKVLLLPDGHDPDSFSKTHSAEEFVTYINQHQVDFIRFKTQLLINSENQDIQNRSQAITSIVESISKIEDPIARSLYVQECAEQTKIREESLIEAVNNTRNIMKIKKIKEQQRSSYTPTTDNTPQTSVVETKNIVNIANSNSSQASAEHNMMKYIVKFGELKIQFNNGSSMSFANYIKESLDDDEINLTSPIYNNIIKEIVEHQDIPNFTATSYLLSHPDDNIRNTALKLSTDKNYTLTVTDNSITGNLLYTADKLLVDLSIAILQDKINATMKAIQNPELTNEEIEENLNKIQNFKQAQVLLKKQL
ncbi:MAG: DNA primase [Bacteroidaceae bacterium]|nr:DNA primase [Bacteroidaceae bacterium]